MYWLFLKCMTNVLTSLITKSSQTNSVSASVHHPEINVSIETKYFIKRNSLLNKKYLTIIIFLTTNVDLQLFLEEQYILLRIFKMKVFYSCERNLYITHLNITELYLCILLNTTNLKRNAQIRILVNQQRPENTLL